MPVFQWEGRGYSDWNLLPFERNAKLRLTLFVVLSRIGKGKERMGAEQK
jgi:hypothetical protein